MDEKKENNPKRVNLTHNRTLEELKHNLTFVEEKRNRKPKKKQYVRMHDTFKKDEPLYIYYGEILIQTTTIRKFCEEQNFDYHKTLVYIDKPIKWHHKYFLKSQK